MRTDSALVSFSLPLPPQLLLVIGGSAMSGKMLELVAALALKQPVTLLDCGNRSNMYAVARAVRPYTNDPVGVMNRIRLSRAFTCYQVLAMLEAVSAAPPREPLLVLDLLATFLDEDVKLRDCQHLLTRGIACLKRLSQSAPVVVSLRPIPPISAARECLMEALRASANAAWEEPAPLPAGFGQQPALF